MAPSINSAGGPLRSPAELIEGAMFPDLARLEWVKLLEALLRATPSDQLGDAAARFARRLRALGQPGGAIPSLFRGLFNEVALSPWTDFVPNTLAFLDHLEGQGALSTEAHVDFLSYLLRQLARHLTAYDLVVFHHRGANYPDALLLDAALKAYLGQIGRRPDLFLRAADGADPHHGRLRRRALRQGWILRRRYEGHPVPDAPTSPGENARVLPPPHIRVPEEQILEPGRRTRKLFAGDPLPAHMGPASRAAWVQSLHDLEQPAELRELGTAVFLDRPLGVFKAPGEPDQTLLMSYEAFSRTIAWERLEMLEKKGVWPPGSAEAESRYPPCQAAQRPPGRKWLPAKSYETAIWHIILREMPVAGLPPPRSAGPPRPGGVALADTYQAARDFLVLRTTPRSVRDFLALIDPASLESLRGVQPALIMRGTAEAEPVEGMLTVYDDRLRARLELRIHPEGGYESRGGVEYPAGRLEVVRAWKA
jgi:hypothetical protein